LVAKTGSDITKHSIGYFMKFFLIFSPFLSFMSSFSSQMITPTDYWKLWGISNCCIKGIRF